MSTFQAYIAKIIQRQMKECHFNELYSRLKNSGLEAEIVNGGDCENIEEIKEELPWAKNAKNVVVCYLGIRNELGL